MSNSRVVGRVSQGVDERIPYQIDTATIGTPTSPTAVVKLRSATGSFSDVTTTVMPTNSPSVSTTIITLSPLRDLTEGAFYRVEVKYTVGGGVYEDIIEVMAEL